MALQIVIDTNVWLSALRSKRGASAALFAAVATGEDERFDVHVSNSLATEFEVKAKELNVDLGLEMSDSEIEDAVDDFCSLAIRHSKVPFLRPQLPDPGDEMLLELAVEAECNLVVTFNTKDFRGSEKFGVRALTPGEFLALLANEST